MCVCVVVSAPEHIIPTLSVKLAERRGGVEGCPLVLVQVIVDTGNRRSRKFGALFLGRQANVTLQHAAIAATC